MARLCLFFQMFTLASAMRHKLGASMTELVVHEKLMVTTRLHRQILIVLVIVIALVVTASDLAL